MSSDRDLRLDVHLEGVDGPVGELTRDGTESLSFSYVRADVPHPISLSLPIREEPFGDVAARAFFSNLLFENAQLDEVIARHGVDRSDVAGLLAHLGRDCPGAISVVPKGEGPGKRPGVLAEDYLPLNDDELADIVASLRDHRRLPRDGGDPSPLAGIQGKVALTRLADGCLAMPAPGSGAPTTHILKVPRASEATLAEHEHVLMEAAARILRHPVARTSIIEAGGIKGLLVERFDRRIEDGAVRRIHQEDFCQALGLSPALKYQRNGGPAGSFDAEGMGRIVSECAAPGPARQALLEGSILDLIFGNTDNHAKNHALLHEGARPVIAPFYDIVPVIADPSVTHQMAFDIGKAKMTEDVTSADLDAFFRALGARRMTKAQRSRLEEILEAAVALIPEMSGPARKRLGDVIAQQSHGLKGALRSSIEVPEWDLVPINRPG